jgi:hypothetical protein
MALTAPLGALVATWTSIRSLQVFTTLGGAALGLLASARATGDGGRGRVPRRLPNVPEPFAGRDRELSNLREIYDEQSQPRTRRLRRSAPIAPNARARTVLIHGQPGVGKRALARVFASNIEAEHPDGSLYFDLATASVPKASGEVLGAMLLDLGVKPEASTEQRTRQFLTATSRRRVLILLENAADLDQVKNLVPNHAGCTVVITSQRPLGGSFGPRSLRLRLPDSRDAARMFHSHASLVAHAAPLAIAEIIELCGRLPSALQAGGELIARSPTELSDLPARLTSEHGRLRALCGPDGPVEREIRQVYQRLGERDQCALRHLALVESSTFLPWVLIPLLDLSYGEASATIKRLAEVELVQRVSADEALGISRYRLHPLTRSFARTELDERESPVALRTARRRLDSAFLAVTALILTRLNPGAPTLEQATGIVPAPVPDLDLVVDRLAEHPDYWVRAEYGNLVRGVEIAHGGRNWALCWRIAARLGSCVPLYTTLETCREAFGKAREAAGADGSGSGVILVCLAEASMLVAIEDHSAALSILAEIDSLIDRYTPASVHEPAPNLLRAARLRIEGEMWLQAASYRAAKTTLGLALEQVAGWKDGAELQRIEVLASEADAALSYEQWLDEPARPDTTSLDDRAEFRAHLARAEWARRQRNWEGARVALVGARGFNHGDARRRAAVEYRFARLRLDESRSAKTPTRHGELATDALIHAATASFRFSHMGNHVGAIRARCMVILALVELGALDHAQRYCAHARQDLKRLQNAAQSPETLIPLRARLDRAEGIVEHLLGDHVDATMHLHEAGQAFADVGDWWSAAECQLYLGQALHKLGKTTSANAKLWTAGEAFERCGDEFNLFRVKEALALEHPGEDARTMRPRRVRRPTRGKVKA